YQGLKTNCVRPSVRLLPCPPCPPVHLPSVPVRLLPVCCPSARLLSVRLSAVRLLSIRPSAACPPLRRLSALPPAAPLPVLPPPSPPFRLLSFCLFVRLPVRPPARLPAHLPSCWLDQCDQNSSGISIQNSRRGKGKGAWLSCLTSAR